MISKLDNCRFKNMGLKTAFLLFTILEMEKVVFRLFLQLIKLILLHAIVGFHYTDHLKMACLIKGEGRNMLKNKSK